MDCRHRKVPYSAALDPMVTAALIRTPPWTGCRLSGTGVMQSTFSVFVMVKEVGRPVPHREPPTPV